MFLLAYRHGLRASEVGTLHTADLDLKQYRLRIERLKQSLAGVHTLRPDEIKSLKAYLRERRSNARALFGARQPIVSTWATRTIEAPYNGGRTCRYRGQHEKFKGLTGR